MSDILKNIITENVNFTGIVEGKVTFLSEKQKAAEVVTKFLKNPTITLVNGYTLTVVNEASYRIFDTEGKFLGEKPMVGGEHMFISQIVTLDIEIMELKERLKDLNESKKS